MGRITERLWVAFTICLISFIAYSSQIFLIWPWYGRELSVDFLLLLLPFNILVGMIFWTYTLTVRTEPGRVPAGWAPDPSQEDVEVKKLTGGPRYCTKCTAYKPPRAHHCKTCRRCVLRMDHHCPWVANCIGFHNHASFIRFLTYVTLACSYHFWMLAYRVWDLAQGSEAAYLTQPDTFEVVLLVLNFAACIPVLCSVGIFNIYHWWSLLGNTTTIEAWEKDKVATLIRRGKIKDVKYPYNLSLVANISSVLGPLPLLWLWPGQRTVGSGTRYRIADGAGEYMSLCWPPHDPSYAPRSAHPSVYAHHPPNISNDTPPSFAFIYGSNALNPALQPHNASTRRRRENPPWAQGAGKARWSDDEDSQDNESGYLQEQVFGDSQNEGDEEMEEGDSDDEPLGLRARMMRRGSEGPEVRSGMAIQRS